MTDNFESHAAQEARRTVDALAGDRPAVLPRRFEQEGELLGTIPAGARSELRIYRKGEEVFIAFWKQDPHSQSGRWVPMAPTEYGFLSIPATTAQDLREILRAL